MDGRENSHTIETDAAQWVARMDRAPLTGPEDRQLQDWLRGDPRRRGAFARARALWLHPETVLTAGSRPVEHAGSQPLESAPPTSQPSGDGTPLRHGRPGFLRWVSALAASLVLSLFLFVSVPVPVAYATAKGEMRRIPLVDGSTLTLNTDTRVDVSEENRGLLVKVRRGEVFIEAAGSEPLQVEVEGRRLEAKAAAFVVRKLDGKPAQVVVQGGRVGLPATQTNPVTLVANTRAFLRAAQDKVQVASLSADQMHRELAWREGKLAFHGETLADAAAEFARYSDTRIVFADIELANAPVTGLFAANNPAGFSRAIAGVFGAQVRQETREEIVVAIED